MARIHHLNCGTMCPFAVADVGAGLVGHFVCHCLLIETEEGLVLVDTGIGTQDTVEGLGLMMKLSCRPRLARAETAVERVKALGFAPEDVRHIVMTHLDLDHAGGMPDFPAAQVHVHTRERDSLERGDFTSRMRYLPRHFTHGVRWQTYSEEGDRWMGLEAIRTLRGVSADIALVPLPGHSFGHCGVAVQDEAGWLLHGGDAFFHRHQVDGAGPVPLGIRIFQNTMVADRSARDRNIARLAELHRGGEVRVMCAHDATTFKQLGGASAS